jgi:hypothetical protein
MNTKTLLTAVSLAALVATPAFAQKHRAHVQDAYASAAEPAYQGYQGGTVVSGGRVIGADPDPQVRFELERDATTYMGAN